MKRSGLTVSDDLTEAELALIERDGGTLAQRAAAQIRRQVARCAVAESGLAACQKLMRDKQWRLEPQARVYVCIECDNARSEGHDQDCLWAHAMGSE